jgi:methionyl-tRNA formyltransferase
MSLRVVFFGNSQNVFSQRYYRALRQTPCTVVGVVDVPPDKRVSTNTDTTSYHADFVADAVKQNVPAYEPASPNTPAFVEQIRELWPDLFLAVGYLFRLKEELLSAVRIVSANVHASLLPAYRGRSPVFWALRHGEKYSGLTVHAMDSQLDTGNLLYQVKVRTRRDDTVATLYERVIAKGLSTVPCLIADAARGRLPRRPQPQEGASYFSAPTEADFRLNWSRPAEEQRRWVVTTPGQCFSDVGDRRVYFLDAAVVPNPDGAPGGTVLAVGPRACVVAAGDAALRLRQVRVGPADPMIMPRFCREVGLRPGMSLGGS